MGTSFFSEWCDAQRYVNECWMNNKLTKNLYWWKLSLQVSLEWIHHRIWSPLPKCSSSSSSSCHGVGGDPFSQMMFSSSPSFYVNYSNYITPPHPPGFDQQQQSSAKSSLMIPLLSDPELAKSKCKGMDGSDDDDQSPSNKKLLNSPSTSPLNLSISNECDSKIDQQTCQYSQASSSLLMSIKSEKRMINQMKSE